jgi:LuxR family maltose regulon positive regulatory protein
MSSHSGGASDTLTSGPLDPRPQEAPAAAEVRGRLHIPAGKIAVPELPVQYTPRPALRQWLDRAIGDQIIVVSAPAGSGKTLLLAEWARTSGTPDTAWISLDADDNDPRRLWSAVMAALLDVPSVSRDGRLEGLFLDTGALTTANLVDELADVLDVLDPPVRVVLDDVHELTGREVLHDLTQLIRRRPAGLRLVLASRSDPPISVPRLRLEGRVHELRADLLRFTPNDTAALISDSGVALTRSEIAVLHERTEGWAAGLRLAVLALRRADDTSAFLTEFSGDERSVADYLTGEILQGLQPDLQDFLRAVSLCSPLPAALAVELSGRADAARVLDDLRQQTALVERTAPGQYRIHALLRSYLVADLARQRPETYRLLQACAARWWSAHRQPVHALRHAERSDDGRLLTHLLHASGVPLMLNGDLGPLQRGLAAVGVEARRTDPRLALMAAMTHLEVRALPAAAAEMQNARKAWPEHPDADLRVLRASVELLASALGVPPGAPVEPVDEIGTTQPEIDALLHASRGLAEFIRPRGADEELARIELEQAVELARVNDLGYLEVQSLSFLANLAAMRGDHRAMVDMAERAVAAAAQRSRHPSAWTAGPAGMLALAELLNGEPTAALARSEESLTSWDPLPPESTYTLRALHGAALADLGRRTAGLAEMRSARLELGGAPLLPSLAANLALLEHRAALLVGNVGAAVEVADWLRHRLGQTGETLLLDAWSEAAVGRSQAARAAVAPVLAGDVTTVLPYTMVESLLVEAEAALQAGEQATGRSALDLALQNAEPLGVVRPFALAGPRTLESLRTGSVPRARGPFRVRLDAARAAMTKDAVVLLSERELAILALLPSLMTAREIAAEFTVSVNTVKSHIRSIYAKFGVSSRREAVLRAQDSGLLP